MKTVVINNREGLVIGQLPHIAPAAGVRGATSQLGPAVVFLPGANLIDSKTLAILRENKSFELNFTTRIPASAAPEQNPEKVGKLMLMVDKSVGKNGEVDDAAPLAKLSAVDCRGLRPEIKRDIHLQLERLATGAVTAGPAASGQ